MEFRYCLNDIEYAVRIDQQQDDEVKAFIDGIAYEVSIQRAQDGQLTLLVDGERVHAYTAATRTPQMRSEKRYVALVDRETCFFELEKVTGSIRRYTSGGASSGLITAQMPGLVMQVTVAEGDSVAEGDLILLLEAMKMEIRVTAPLSGRIDQLAVGTGDQVERGQFLVEVISTNEDSE